MKTWYRVVCDNHGEAIEFFVNNPITTYAYLGEHNAEIGEWFNDHWGCPKRMINDDFELDPLWDSGWKRDPDSKIGRLYKKPLDKPDGSWYD